MWLNLCVLHKDNSAWLQPCWSSTKFHGGCETLWLVGLSRSPSSHLMTSCLSKLEIGLIREDDLTPVLYGPGYSLLLIDEGFFIALHDFTLPLGACFELSLLCISLQLPFFVGHLMSSYGCWVTYEWVDSHPGKWRFVFTNLQICSFVVSNVCCMTLFLWTMVNSYFLI